MGVHNVSSFFAVIVNFSYRFIFCMSVTKCYEIKLENLLRPKSYGQETKTYFKATVSDVFKKAFFATLG